MNTTQETTHDKLEKIKRHYPAGLALFATGVVLGALAFAADFVPGIPGGIMTGLVSSGAAWGAPAAIIGFTCARRRSAMVNQPSR